MKQSVTLYTLLSIFLCIDCIGQSALHLTTDDDKRLVEKFHLSIDAGLNLSTLPGLAQQQSIFGINLGVGAYIRLSDKWALTPEFKPLSGRGAANVKSIYNDVSVQNPKTDIVTNYIDIPVLIQYAVSKKINVAAGPQISFLTSANQRTTGNLASGQDIVVSENIRSLMHKESFMVPVQVGYSFSKTRGPSGAGMKFRYNIGIMEAFTATSIATSTNSTFQVILSIPFIYSSKEGK